MSAFRAICGLPFACLTFLFEILTAIVSGISPCAQIVIFRSEEQYFFIGRGRLRVLDMESAFAAARFELATAYDREREKSEGVA